MNNDCKDEREELKKATQELSLLPRASPPPQNTLIPRDGDIPVIIISPEMEALFAENSAKADAAKKRFDEALLALSECQKRNSLAEVTLNA